MKTESTVMQLIEKLHAKRELLSSMQSQLPDTKPGIEIKRDLAILSSSYMEEMRKRFSEMEGEELIIRRHDGRRTRTSLAGKVLDLSNIRPSITHRFRDHTVIIGRLNKEAVHRLDGKSWSGRTVELIDMLYRVDKTDKGFASEMERLKVHQNPLAMFTEKARGKLVEEAEAVPA